MKKLRKLCIIFALGLFLAGCSARKTQTEELLPAVQEGSQDATGSAEGETRNSAGSAKEEAQDTTDSAGRKEQNGTGSAEGEMKDGTSSAEKEAKTSEPEEGKEAGTEQDRETFSEEAGRKAAKAAYIDVPLYSGKAYTEINGNVPFFTDDELSAVSYEYYEELDELGRCGVCMASVGQDIMPTKERESIGDVKPTGWHTVKYEGLVDGNYLYNRCHLLGFQLTGENANRKNLITGTRYMNVEGMLPFENMVADYVKETGNHVMYRVTPLFDGDNLVADGVLMEAKSVEDNGADILFNVFCYNVQPGVSIDYATGESSLDESAAAQNGNDVFLPAESGKYAVNAGNGKIHIVGKCPATGDSDNAMDEPVYFDTYEEAAAYSISIAPNENIRQCGNCW